MVTYHAFYNGKSEMNDKFRDLEKITLSKMSISELRKVGRSVGVKSPTNATKEDLVEGILSIVLGEDDSLGETRGRPTDKFYSYSCAIEPNIETLSSGVFATTDFSEAKMCNYLNCGIVVCEGGERYVLNFQLDPKSRIKLCAEYAMELKTGDTVSFLPRNGEAIVIEYLGRFLVEEDKTEDFDKLGIIYPNKKYKTTEEVDALTPIAMGSRTIMFDDSVLLDSLHFKIIQEITKRLEPPTVVAFCYEISDEDFAKIGAIAGVNVRVFADDREELINYKLSILREFIKRNAEFSSDTIIYFPGTSSLNKSTNVNRIILNWLIDLLKISGRYKNDATITTLVNCSNALLFEKLSKYSTNLIMTSGDDELRIEPELSETMFKEAFLTIKEIEKIDYAKKNWSKMTKTQKRNLILR